MTTASKLEAAREAGRTVSALRMALVDAGVMDYGDGSDVQVATYALTEALDGVIIAYKREIAKSEKWSGGTKPEWRTHGTVIASRNFPEHGYCLDPNFNEPGSHFVWLDGYNYFSGSDRRGGWAELRD